MKKIYKTPELDITIFEINKDILDAADEQESQINIIPEPWAGSDPDETLDDFEW